MIVTERKYMCLCVRVVAHPPSVLKVLVTTGYKRADVLVQIVRIITLVHLRLSLVDNPLVSLASIVTDLLMDAVSQVNRVALDAVVAAALITLDIVVVVDVALHRRNSNDIKTNEEDLLASVADALVARILAQSVHTLIALVNRRQRIPNGVRST